MESCKALLLHEGVEASVPASWRLLQTVECSDKSEHMSFVLGALEFEVEGSDFWVFMVA